MRVDASLSFPENLPNQKVGRSNNPAVPNPAASVTSQDQAQLSVDSVNIQQLKVRLASVPEIRQERVDSLRQSISTGSYNVPDHQLSDAVASDPLNRIIG